MHTRITLTLTALLLSAIARADGPGGSPAQWRSHLDALRREPGLARLLTPADAAAQTVEGRWSGLRAARIDETPVTYDLLPVGPEGFTVEVWFRKNGPGTLRGNDNAPNGTLVSQGNGYWDGWRVTTSYPANTFGFEIGRPQPSSSAGFFGVGALPDGAWHHLAASWDGKAMRLYLNGAPAGSMPYAGAYTPPAPGDRFRVGYAAAGFGSVRFDVDCVALWRRALTPAEVLRHALFHEPAATAPDYALAAAARAVRAGRSLPGAPDLTALARLEAARELRAQGRAADAARLYAAVATSTGVSDRFRLTALLPLAELAGSAADAVPAAALERLAAHPSIDAASRYAVRHALARTLLSRPATRARGRALYASLMRHPMTTPASRLALRIETAHGLRAAGDLSGARAAYAAIAADGTAPAHWRSYAALLEGRALAQDRKWAEAAAVFRRLSAQGAAPELHRWEAAEALREMPRLRRGLPARDPAWSRVKLPQAPAPAVTLYVSPRGSDTAPGTRARPLASLGGAAAAVRAIKARGPLPRGGVAVLFRAGAYPADRTVVLSAADSGTARAPVVYRAYPGERPVITGGVRLAGFRPVTDPATLARLPAEARGRALSLNLREAGVANPGVNAPRGVGTPHAPVTELFWNGKALEPARWPNTGWSTTGEVIAERAATGGFAFRYNGDRPSRWVGAKDAWLFGYWKWLWADVGVGLAAVDPAARTLTTAHPSSYGVQAGMPYFAYHLLEELDAPGEWHLDRDTGLLTVWPPADPARSTVELSLLEAPFIEMDGVSHLRIEGLTFELGRTDGIVLKGGARCLFAGCTVRKLGGTAITIDGGKAHGIFGCDLSTLGRGGAVVRGGDRRTLAPGGHFVENCRVSDFSRWHRTYTPAVQGDGVGLRIAHNLFERSPGHAMRIEGNDHVIEFNEVRHVVTETDDQGGLDMWFNPTYRGVVVRYNFWHHIGDGQDRMMRAGIRLDDAICGVAIYGNVFWKASEGYFGGVQIHGGKDNVVANNLFVDCKFGISHSRWGPDRWRQYIESEPFRKATRQDVDIAAPPYSTRYPALARLAEGADVNSIWSNVAYRCGDFLTRDGGIQDLMDNLVTGRDPGFTDAAKGDFTMAPGSWVYQAAGFRPIPFAEIGRYAHPLRAGP